MFWQRESGSRALDPGSAEIDDGKHDRLVRLQKLLSGKPDPLACRRRHSADCRHHDRHHDHGQQFPRTCAEEQRTRTGKHRIAAVAPFRSTTRRHRGHSKRLHRIYQIARGHLEREFQVSDVRPGHPLDAQGQAERAVLCRRHHHFRCRRKADQRIRDVACHPTSASRTGPISRPSNRTLDRRNC